jgi:UDP-N-acetylglucosamine acyltransferase
MAVLIADSAWVDSRARLGDEVEIGPFCIVEGEVSLGRSTRLVGHVCIRGGAELGEYNVVHPFCVIGGEPQEPALRGVARRTVVGSHNTFHEGVIVNCGGTADGGATRIGCHNYLQAGAHVAHDGTIGNRITLGNASIIGPRVWIEDLATLAPGVSVHHDVTVGELSFIGGQSRIYHDVPPYMLVDGHPARVRCINAVGLRKRRLEAEAIDAIHEAHRLLYRARMQPKQAIEILTAHGHWTPEVQRLMEAVQTQNDGRHGRAREPRRSEPQTRGGVEIQA